MARSYMDAFRSNNSSPFESRRWRNLARNLSPGNNSSWDRSYNNNFSLTAFGTGLLVGVGVALLLAPKSGRELRDDITRRAGSIGENVRNRLPTMTDRENTNDMNRNRPKADKPGAMTTNPAT